MVFLPFIIITLLLLFSLTLQLNGLFFLMLRLHEKTKGNSTSETRLIFWNSEPLKNYMSWGDIFSSIGDDVSVAKLWGSMVAVCAVATGVLHGLIGIYGSWRLLRRSWKWIMLPIGLTLYGALAAFISLSPMIVFIAGAYKQAHFHLSVYEFSIYCSVMILTVIIFSFGRKTVLFSM